MICFWPIFVRFLENVVFYRNGVFFRIVLDLDLCRSPAVGEHPSMAAQVSLIKLTFSHDTSPHCTRFSRILRTERRESDVRCCWPGDTRATTSRYACSTAGDPHTETNKPQLATSNSAEPRMSENWRDEKWISLREKQSHVEAESVSGFFCRSIKLQSSAHGLYHFQCAWALHGDWLTGGLWCPIPVCQTCLQQHSSTAH